LILIKLIKILLINFYQLKINILNNMIKKIITLGPASLNSSTIKKLQKGTYIFRINLSHVSLKKVPSLIKKIQKSTKVPVCIDTEGAQIRNKLMKNGKVLFKKNSLISIHKNLKKGDKKNISFHPPNAFDIFKVGDTLKIDFDSAEIKIIKKINNLKLLAKVISGGVIGSNKGVDINRDIKLDPITQKDFKAIQIAKKMKVKYFSFSFASCESDVKKMRNIIGNNSILISKIENKKGVKNLEEILKFSDSIIIDRGDLSRQVPIYKIPITQREIIKRARKKNKDTFVATNLLENMIEKINPTRAEVNDVISTLEMGAKGLVLAAETAIGKHPVETVGMINNLIKAFKKIQKN
tara:strand:+ start:2925 stop:3980 length:1056 start_codon:yes stop_codon:yes gene_type:complete